MPSFEKHCDQTSRLLGRSFEQVNPWLDELAGKQPYGMKHRRKRPNTAGVEEVRRMFVDQVAIGARLHIGMDLAEGGWTKSDPYPRDEQHFVSMGLY